MEIMEESQRKKKELRDKVENWKKAHPDWASSEAMDTAKLT